MMVLRVSPQLCAYWSTALEPFWGDRKAHVQPASEGTGKGPDTAEFTAQAGEGWYMMLLNFLP